jgi:asparagine synthase (glutamine-hydrolysing)
VVAAARIDNTPELTVQLGLDGAASPGEAATILAAYRRWGKECAFHLDGDFSFALWDSSLRAVLLATDAFGARPLHYHLTPSRLMFATEAGAILLAGVPKILDETRLLDYLLADVGGSERTLFVGIQRLAGAHCLWVDSAGDRLWRYWDIDDREELAPASDLDYADRFIELLGASVRRRTPSGTAWACLLSGGLDSSTITALAARASVHIKAVSAVYDKNPQCDERPWINAMASHCDIDVNLVHPEALDPLALAAVEPEYPDEPVFNPQGSLHVAAAVRAREAGFVVLLDGHGGDDVVSHGLETLWDLGHSWRWIALIREARALKRRGTVDSRLVQLLRTWGLTAALPAEIYGGWRALTGKARRSRAAGPPLTPEFSARVGSLQRLRETEREHVRDPRIARRTHAEGLRGGLYPFTLALMDRAMAHQGVELRYPFLDRALVEFCVALPASQKLHDGWSRYVERRAGAGLVPDSVRWRVAKSNLGPVLSTSMRGLAGTVLYDPSTHGSAPIASYVDMRRISEVVERFELVPTARDAWLLWRVAVVGRWLEQMRFG